MKTTVTTHDRNRRAKKDALEDPAKQVKTCNTITEIDRVVINAQNNHAVKVATDDS